MFPFSKYRSKIPLWEVCGGGSKGFFSWLWWRTPITYHPRIPETEASGSRWVLGQPSQENRQGYTKKSYLEKRIYLAYFMCECFCALLACSCTRAWEGTGCPHTAVADAVRHPLGVELNLHPLQEQTMPRTAESSL